jgi:hypothetical protein
VGRAGDSVDVHVDVEVPDPWIERPKLGREVRDVDGHGAPGVSVAFECDRGTGVPAFFSGTAQVRDTRIDVHTPAGFPDAGAGRGYEVTLRSQGGAEVRYGHLARGSGKQGSVKAGEVIGQSGNTGRCVDGCGRQFVLVEFSGMRHARTLDELCQPIELELWVDGKQQGRPVRFPAGETSARGIAVGRASAPRDRNSGDERRAMRVEVRATRRGTTIAEARVEITVKL